MYFSIIAIVLESIMDPICCITRCICSTMASPLMKATFANEAAAYTKAERMAAALPKLNVSLLVTSGCDSANFPMKNFMSMMHPLNFAAHNIKLNIEIMKPEAPDISCVTNI